MINFEKYYTLLNNMTVIVDNIEWLGCSMICNVTDQVIASNDDNWLNFNAIDGHLLETAELMIKSSEYFDDKYLANYDVCQDDCSKCPYAEIVEDVAWSGIRIYCRKESCWL